MALLDGATKGLVEEVAPNSLQLGELVEDGVEVLDLLEYGVAGDLEGVLGRASLDEMVWE